VLALSGEIDMWGADRLDDLLREPIARAPPVNAAGQVRQVLDMTGLMQLLGGAAGSPPVAT
jgi:anti-sigma B factor antagonist